MPDIKMRDLEFGMSSAVSGVQTMGRSARIAYEIATPLIDFMS